MAFFVVHNVIHNVILGCFEEFMTYSSNHKWQKVTNYCYEWYFKWQRPQFSVMKGIVNDKKGQYIVNDSFAHFYLRNLQ